jgi:membrane protein YqaA with SNARE-associated domain
VPRISSFADVTALDLAGLRLARHGEELVRSFSRWIVGVFVSPAGIVVLGALDSTMFFSLPFGIDAAVVILAARLHALAWLVPLLATGGSLAGAALTYWMGVKIGEQGLDRYVSGGRLKRVRRTINEKGAVALAVLDLIPPPFPFTPFVLAAGALKVRGVTFFTTLAICRVFRFGLETVLALVYGRRIVSWLDSDVFHDIVAGFIALAIVLTIVSIVRLVRTSRPAKRSAAA